MSNHWDELRRLGKESAGKKCNDCKEVKPVSEFYKKGDGLDSYCRGCRDKRAKERRKNNKERVAKQKKKYHDSPSFEFPSLSNGQLCDLRRKYKPTDEQILHYINTTHCEFCGKKFKNSNDRCQDHCHHAHTIRKVICRRCNNGLGWLESVGIVKAIEYVTGYEESPHHTYLSAAGKLYSLDEKTYELSQVQPVSLPHLHRISDQLPHPFSEDTSC